MTFGENPRPGAARLTGFCLAAGLAALTAGGAAQANSPTPLARALFDPVKPAATVRLSTAEDAQPALPALPAPTQITFDSPLPGFAVNSQFGLRQMSFEPHAREHKGVDIAAPTGTPVHAAADGFVYRSGVSPSYGRYVEVAHADGLTTFYAHLSRAADLAAGAFIHAGEVLGFVGSTGHSTGAHLHFEIRHGLDALNPLAFVGHSFDSEGELPLTSQARAGAGFHARHVLRASSRWSSRLSAHWHVRGHSGVRMAALHHGRFSRGG